MDSRLIEVAKNGEIDALYALLGENPFILENVEKIPFINTPLHWAVLSGHTCLVEEMINLKPSFTLKLNQDGFSPLHLASMFGHLEIVKALLKDESGQCLEKQKAAMNVDGGLCNLKGREKRIPLHCAAISGHTDVLEVLLSSFPNSINALTVRKESILHLAVKFGKVEAFKVLVNWLRKHWRIDILGCKDQEGNTVLHLATSKGQYQMINVLLRNSLLVRNVVPVNAKNDKGLTALDLLMHLPGSNPDRERIKTILSKVGAKKADDIGCQLQAKTNSLLEWVSNSKIKYVSKYLKLKVDKDTPSEARNALLVIVVLISTATYQTGVSPPGGYWQNDLISNGTYVYHAGEPVWSTTSPITYNLVMLFNFAGFMLSSLLAYNLTVGFPLRGPLLLALVFMLLTYSWSTPIFYNGPASRAEYFWHANNLMLWLPVGFVVIIWAITANWMGQIWWKLSLFIGLVRE
ncbi:ankyrin repeat-containing protein BDA1-like [Macadamia integrifolia]|uniref:ankyrin repeat-containing protein BDA1-like n=1 Tax=Macadamia integrifolia TaxID=60698 RepID=UPI001C4FBFE9|nr:ankyrin repeat-containing protein BDA1-like [Macadamia integrifolia]